MTQPRSRQGKPRRLLGIALMIGLAMVGTGLAISFVKDEGSSEKVVRQQWAADAPSGPVRFCAGDDVSGGQRRTERGLQPQIPRVDRHLRRGVVHRRLTA